MLVVSPVITYLQSVNSHYQTCTIVLPLRKYFTSFLLVSTVVFGVSVVDVVVVVVDAVVSRSGRSSAGSTPISLSVTTGVGRKGPFLSISRYASKPLNCGRISEDLC